MRVSTIIILFSLCMFMPQVSASTSTSVTPASVLIEPTSTTFVMPPAAIIESNLEEKLSEYEEIKEDYIGFLIRKAGQNTTVRKVVRELPSEKIENRTRRYPDSPGVEHGGDFLCGAFYDICTVHFDSIKDKAPDCCTVTDNPECRQCLPECVEVCNKQGFGVLSCFGNMSSGIGCECTKEPPTCYDLPAGTYNQTMTTQTMVKESGGRYLVMMIILFVAIIGLLLYVRAL